MHILIINFFSGNLSFSLTRMREVVREKSRVMALFPNTFSIPYLPLGYGLSCMPQTERMPQPGADFKTENTFLCYFISITNHVIT